MQSAASDKVKVVLFKHQFSKEFRAMELRFRKFNRRPGKEVRSLELIATLVEIGTHSLSVKTGDFMTEDSGCRDNQGHFPGTLPYSFFERLSTQ